MGFLADFDLLLEKLRGHLHVKHSQNIEPSVGIMNSQSVKWGNNASLNGVDGHKRRHKRHIISIQKWFLLPLWLTWSMYMIAKPLIY